MNKRFLTAKEVAIYLSLSENTIRAWVKLGRIPFSKLGRSVRFDLRAIDKWLGDKEIHVIKEVFI